MARPAQREEMMTLDDAAKEAIADAESDPRLIDKSRYGVHRHAEVQAWANAEARGGAKTEVGAQFAALAGRIADMFHSGITKRTRFETA